MKAAVGLSVIVAGIAGLCGCTAAIAPPLAAPVASSCPPDGSFEPFSKVMSAAFVASYDGCNITTTAKFIGTGTAAMLLGGIENNYVMIRVVPPGEQNPAGLQSPNYVALPKEGSDLAFLLKPGEAVILKGGTKYNQQVPTLSVFVANSIARAK